MDSPFSFYSTQSKRNDRPEEQITLNSFASTSARRPVVFLSPVCPPRSERLHSGDFPHLRQPVLLSWCSRSLSHWERGSDEKRLSTFPSPHVRTHRHSVRRFPRGQMARWRTVPADALGDALAGCSPQRLRLARSQAVTRCHFYPFSLKRGCCWRSRSCIYFFSWRM